MDILLTYHLYSLNQMLELSETDSGLHNLHPVRELDTDGDLLADVGHTISGILEGMPDRIMNLTLFAHSIRFRLDLCIFRRITCHCHRIYPLMCLAVPFVESRIVRSSSARLLPKGRKNSMLCAELLYRDVLRKALGLVQKPKALKIFATVYHLSHS